MFIDFHTHQNKNKSEIQTVFNLVIPTDEEAIENFNLENFSENQLFSAGIHPYFINPIQIDFQFELLRQVAVNQQVRFIGECGLDRLRGASLALQEQVFIKQIRLAEELRKPLVIHCVRCFSELFSIKKIIRPKIPMVVHGYQSNLEIAQQLLAKGFYFSLGKAVFLENIQELIKILPLEKLFLETDDEAIEIDKIYETVAHLKGISIEELSQQIQDNFIEIGLF
jgi:TatD DNase family protein